MTHLSPAPSVPSRTIRRGLGVLWQGCREEPRIFALSVVGSLVFAFTTIGQAYVFGAVTARVIVPGIRDGRTSTAALAAALLAVLAMASLKVVGMVGRRLGAGVMMLSV